MNVCRTLFLVLGIILTQLCLVQCSSCSFPSESEKFSVNYELVKFLSTVDTSAARPVELLIRVASCLKVCTC